MKFVLPESREFGGVNSIPIPELAGLGMIFSMPSSLVVFIAAPIR
jgi:hypothetical protein